ncbi:acid phosphatase 1-like [Actinidia eriantha]|uniref:acid phosphatase 1-like n=1 Tax=Actinidia eriantha TaxID=165200 RepID=UPI002587BB23|nr:acid phosphatase 1-like [Actinidia eriantha]
METGRYVAVLLILSLVSKSLSHMIIQIPPENHRSAASDGRRNRDADDLYCDSWRFSVETNDAGTWRQIPSRCEEYVKEYMTGARYLSDSDVASGDSLAFANTVELAGNGKDAWIFDIDETLLSNIPYYAAHGFGSEIFDENSFDEWIELAEAPALPASLKLYKEVEQLGFTIFLLTGRAEAQRNATVKNLLFAGYSNWERLILRGPSDLGKPAIVYKSEKRKELDDEGYTIHASSGDQWSDLFGFSTAIRSFKLPNPMYYIA